MFVTTRILVVDFLCSRLAPTEVAGIIVLNAHRVTDTCGEGFAARLYRAGNRSGFVRAFSDDPVQFTQGFNKAGNETARASVYYECYFDCCALQHLSKVPFPACTVAVT